MNFGVVVFPGSNCDADCYYVIKDVMGQPVRYVWHQERSLQGLDCVVLPGGFSYGDYLRTGAIARFSPVMEAVQDFADRGGIVLGICNGFQILCEAGLLPGVLMQNTGLRFLCKFLHVRVETTETPFTNACRVGDVLHMPIAHHGGNYFADTAALNQLRASDQIVLRYCSPEGEVSPAYNPNGSLDNIAGICSARRNVFGLMPHPERASEAILGSEDGRAIFASIIASAAACR
ncbi:MAG: phosphoribosylformylglycinamidine synthase subunit PurQ [Armatimonadota bacterium]